MNATHRGFTLIETIISTAILGAVMLMVTQSLDSGTKLNDRVSRTAELNGKANDAINVLALQLRVAAVGDSAHPNWQMLLPGPYLTSYTPMVAGSSQVAVYYFTVSTGVSSATWTPTYEQNKRTLIYDYSTNPGKLLLRRYDAATGALAQETLLSDQVAENGFSLTRSGNILNMALTLRTITRAQEEIIYTAKAQTIFLRSTMSESSGASPSTFVDDPSITTPSQTTSIALVRTQSNPSLLFGNLVTMLDSTNRQISLIVVAPIGESINASSMQVEIGVGSYVTVAEGRTVTAAGCTVTRATQPSSTQWPSPSGTYILTLTGTITGAINVRVTATTNSGKSCTDFRNYN